jgi:sugar fermentation stimulation protein A
MIFTPSLIPGKLIKRYKRFLADIELECGEIITAHCPNSGSMKSCVGDGWEVYLSYHENPNRKYPHTWEMVHNGKCWIGINTGIPNRLAEEAIQTGRITELLGYDEIKREIKYGKNSRIDLLLNRGTELCYVEVKNVTLVEEDGNYYFPDSVTLRGQKHLNELWNMVKEGNRAVMLYVIQRCDGKIFKPAAHIDLAYANKLKEVYKQGVEILVYRAKVSPNEIKISEKIQWELT